ncbi:MAG: hypothetical protein WBB45_19950 [Cyclobacteriaceae bacterium]
MSYTYEIIVFCLIGVCVLLALGLLYYLFRQVYRTMAMAGQGMETTLAYLQWEQDNYERGQDRRILEASRRLNQRELRIQLVENRLRTMLGEVVYNTELLHEIIGSREPGLKPYFIDVLEAVERSGLVTRLLGACLSANVLSHYGLYGMLYAYCKEPFTDVYKHMELTCNDQHYRLPIEVEEELSVSFLLLFSYFAFDRTPDHLELTLHFGEQYVSFTIQDDDPDALNAIALTHRDFKDWPGGLHQAHTYAGLHHGYAEADTTYLQGLRFTMHVPYLQPKEPPLLD